MKLPPAALVFIGLVIGSGSTATLIDMLHHDTPEPPLPEVVDLTPEAFFADGIVLVQQGGQFTRHLTRCVFRPRNLPGGQATCVDYGEINLISNEKDDKQ